MCLGDREKHALSSSHCVHMFVGQIESLEFIEFKKRPLPPPQICADLAPLRCLYSRKPLIHKHFVQTVET